MAALTWRDVQAPDFRSSMQGYAQFSELLNGAFGGAERALDKVDTSITDRVNSEIMAKVAQANSPEEAEALAAQVYSDPRLAGRANAASASAIMGRKGQVLQDDTAANALDWSQYTQGRTKGDNDALDAAKSDAAQYLTLSMNGQDAEAAQFANGSSTIKGMTVAQMMELFQGGLGMAKDKVGITGERQDQTIQMNQEGRDSTKFGWDSEDRADETAAADVASIALAGGGGDAEGTRASFMENAGRLSPRALIKAMELVNTRLGSGIFAPDEIAAVGGGTSEGVSGGNTTGDPVRVMNYEAAQAGFGTVPSSVKTLGDASNFAKTLTNRGINSSAMGVYQIVGQTMRGKNGKGGYAEKAFGKNWQSVEFNFENQDKMAELIFNDHRNSADALRKQWVSLSPAEAERVRKMPWKQAREFIAQGESSSSPAKLGLATVAIEKSTEGRSMQNNRDGMVADFDALKGDSRKASEIVAELVGTEKAPGVFFGTSKGFLLTQVNNVARQGRVNPAIAGAILSRNISEKRDLPLDKLARNARWAGSWIGLSTAAQPDLGGGIRINEAGVANSIENYRKGRVYDRAASNAVQEKTGPQIAALQTKYTAAQNELAKAERRAATGGISASNLARIRQRRSAALLEWQAAITSVAGKVDANGKRVGSNPDLAITDGDNRDKSLFERTFGFAL